MRKIWTVLLFILMILGLLSFSQRTHNYETEHFYLYKKLKPVGISIVLYRVDKAEKIEELSNLEKQMDRTKSINLYKATEDLSIIFMNTADPYFKKETLQYKMLFGKYVNKQVGEKIINGFISSREVLNICDWIKMNKVDSFDGFSKMYDNLSREAKEELENIGADNKISLFEGYVKPLTQFYFEALRDNNSIVICGE